jgi:hypothetical protein
MPPDTNQFLGDLVSRIESFRELADGWLNGEGTPIKVDKILPLLKVHFNSLQVRTYAYPMVNGGIELCWVDKNINKEISLEIDPDSLVGDYYEFGSPKEDDFFTKPIDLNNSYEMEWLVTQISLIVKA